MATFVAGLEPTVVRRLEATFMRRAEGSRATWGVGRRAFGAALERAAFEVATLEIATVSTLGEAWTLAKAVASRRLAVEVAAA